MLSKYCHSKFSGLFSATLIAFSLSLFAAKSFAMTYADCSAKCGVCETIGMEEWSCRPGSEIKALPAPTKGLSRSQCDAQNGTWVPGDSNVSGDCVVSTVPIPQPKPKQEAQSCESKCSNVKSEGANSECLRRCDPTREAATPAAPAPPSPEELAQQCISQSQAAVSSCNSSKESALNTCDSENNSSLSGAASQATLALGQNTGSSVQAACSNMGGVSQGANAGLAAYRTQCQSSKNTCTNSCTSAKNAMDQCANQKADPSSVKSAMQGMSEYQDVVNSNTSCVALQTKIDQANQAISNYANTTANAMDCANATSAMDPSMDVSQANDPNSAYCQAHPTIASCVVDCSKPEMANNPTCTYLKNPYANTGTNAEKPTGLSAVGGGYAAPTAANANDLKLGADEPWLGTSDLADRIAQARAGSAENIGGKTGNAANVGASGAGGPAGAPRKPGAFFDDSNAGAVGGGGFYGAGSGGAGGGAYAAAAAARARYMAANGLQGQQATPDLRQFLPGGRMDPRRTIAGVSGPDGITGPNSNIWQKVQNRYRMMSNTLLP